jgi:hypothetical protein
MRIRVKAQTALDCSGIAVAVIVTRFACRSHFLYDIDSVNFALALDRFDPGIHQPHPPGYYLYVCTGRLVNAVLHDANASLVAISIVASAVAAVFIYLLTLDWFQRRAALFAGGLFVLSPLCWFHGTVALTYIVEAFFSVLIGLLCWRGKIVPAAIALGLSAGFRPSSIVFLGPLWVYSLLKCRGRRRIAAVGTLVLTLAAWMTPMLVSVGGVSAYLGPLWTLWNLVPARQSSLLGLPFAFIARAGIIAAAAGLSFGAAMFLLLRRSPEQSSEVARIRLFVWVWIAPGLAFFSLVFLLFVNSGYLLFLSPPVFAFLGLRAARWSEAMRDRRLRAGIIAAAATANAGIYLCVPLYCGYAQVRKFETDLVRATDAVRADFDPAGTLIVGFDSHFLGYRHAAYYLPEFLTVQYPAVRTVQGTRIFGVRSRRTELLSGLPLDSYRDFVVFPLPEGPKYEKYASAQLARLPESCWHRLDGARPPLVYGDARALGYLFGGCPSDRTPTAPDCKHALTPIGVNKRKPGHFTPISVGCSIAHNPCEPLGSIIQPGDSSK